MTRITLAAATFSALFIGLGVSTGVPAGEVSTPAEADGFRLERSYYAPTDVPSTTDLRSLIQTLDRAREVRPISSGSLNRDYSLEAALWEQAWRARVSEELESLFK